VFLELVIKKITSLTTQLLFVNFIIKEFSLFTITFFFF